MRIWLIHGVVTRRDPESFRHRDLLDAESFQSYLERRRSRFVDIDEAIASGREALTVDDGTLAAANAAELCRAAGHAVTLFVNAGNIVRQQPYWFVLLNALVDGCDLGAIRLGNERFSLDTTPQRNRFRKAAKLAALSLRNDEERANFMLRLARSVGLESLEVPEALTTISLDRLLRLRESGTRIENHGWTHGDVTSMSLKELAGDIRRGAHWLCDVAAVATKHYAVPFGAAMPPAELLPALYGWWHLADASLPAGRLGNQVVNRVILPGDAL